MYKRLNRLRLIPVILLVGLALACCSPAPPAEPATEQTAESAVTETQAAATVLPTEPPNTIGYYTDDDGYCHIRRYRYPEGERPAVSFRHAYDSLEGDRARQVYDALYEGAYIVSPARSERDPSVYAIRPVVLEGDGFTAVDIYSAIIAVIDDHPELFWLYGGVSFSAGSETRTVLFPGSLYSPEEIIEIMEAMDAAVSSLIENAPDGADDRTLERYLHDRLVETCDYDAAAADAEDYFAFPYASKANGAIVDHAAMCEGYARGFCFLCRQTGLDCVYLCGYANGSAHAWNAVLIDSRWYQVDVTWDDMLDSDAYFNLDDATMLTDHTLCEPLGQMTEEDALSAPYYNSFIPL